MPHQCPNREEFSFHHLWIPPKTNSTDEECPLCMEPYTERRRSLQIQQGHCRHIFCDLCLGNWLDLANTCPLCRTELYPMTPKGESRYLMDVEALLRDVLDRMDAVHRRYPQERHLIISIKRAVDVLDAVSKLERMKRLQRGVDDVGGYVRHRRVDVAVRGWVAGIERR